jgi:hypothetical protein
LLPSLLQLPNQLLLQSQLQLKLLSLLKQSQSPNLKPSHQNPQ